MKIDKFCETHNTTIDELSSESRKANIVLKRHVAMYLLREGNYNTELIGSIFNRDHSTVTYAHKRIGELIGIDKNVKAMVDKSKEQ